MKRKHSDEESPGRVDFKRFLQYVTAFSEGVNELTYFLRDFNIDSVEVVIFRSRMPGSPGTSYQFPRTWLEKAGTYFDAHKDEPKIELKCVPEDAFDCFVYWLLFGKLPLHSCEHPSKTRRLFDLISLSAHIGNSEFHNTVVKAMVPTLADLKNSFVFPRFVTLG
jgi:hypothetical protein